jgi:hypothetical protein
VALFVVSFRNFKTRSYVIAVQAVGYFSTANYYCAMFMNHKVTKNTKKARNFCIQSSDALQIVRLHQFSSLLTELLVGKQLLLPRIPAPSPLCPWCLGGLT